MWKCQADRRKLTKASTAPRRHGPGHTGCSGDRTKSWRYDSWWHRFSREEQGPKRIPGSGAAQWGCCQNGDPDLQECGNYPSQQTDLYSLQGKILSWGWCETAQENFMGLWGTICQAGQRIWIRLSTLFLCVFCSQTVSQPFADNMPKGSWPKDPRVVFQTLPMRTLHTEVFWCGHFETSRVRLSQHPRGRSKAESRWVVYRSLSEVFVSFP